ncbi:DNA glycosylase AlkZ-like family protein [Rhodocyclus tenuis]|uniref:DNA glycosylase AlkZ-like family protein n=1 Tax=Rhodocyclus tenuis TaxID=1066 RepID=UPI003B8A942B
MGMSKDQISAPPCELAGGDSREASAGPASPAAAKRSRRVPALAHSPAMQRIVAVIQRKSEMSVADISAEAFVGVTTLACGGYLRQLKAAGLIHISGWRKTRRGFSTPLYSLGNQADLPRPEYSDQERDCPGMDRIVEALLHYGPATYPELAKISGLSRHTLKNSGYLQALRAQQRIFISAWRRSRNGPMQAVYALAPGSDAPKPAKLTVAEKNRHCRERKRVLLGDRCLLAQLNGLASS